MTIGSDVDPSRRSKNRRTTNAQQAQWQFQADLLDQLSDAVIAVDLDERITYLNRAAVAQYGVDPVSALGQPLSHAYRYEWLQPEDELLADSALVQQGHWRGENRHIRQDGSTLHVESQVTMLRDEAGNATGLLATIRDITDRKQMERELRASERRYRRLADTLPQLVWSADVVGVTDYYNIHIHDFDPSVWQGTKGFDWESLLHPDDLAPTLAIWQEAVTQRRPYSCEHRMRMADGSWRWHLSRAVLVQDPDNGLRWYGTATDIHERKTAEEALRANQRLMQAIVNISPTVIYIHDLIARLNVFVSPQAAVTLGYTAAEFAAFAPELIQKLMHPDDQLAIEGHFDRLATAADSAVFEFEYRMRHKDGRWCWFLTRDLIFQRTPDGRPAQVLGVAMEITERKAAEDALRAHQERLQLGIQVAGLVLAEVDYATDLIHLDPAAAKLYGLPADGGAVPRATVHATFHPDDAPEIFQRMVASFDPTGPGWFAMAHRVVHPDGAIRWLNVRKQIFFATAADGTRRPIRALLAAFDMTEQKAIEEALRANEQRWRLAMDAAKMAAWSLDLTTETITWSPNVEAIFGLPTDAFGNTQEQALTVIHAEDQALVTQAIAQAVQGTGHYECEFRMVRPDGSIVWVLDRGEIAYDEAGRPLCLNGVSVNITARKQAEEQLAFHANLLNYAYDGVIATDADLNITAWNSGAEEAYGWRAAEVRGRKPHEVLQSSMTPAARAEAVRQMAESGRFRVEVTLHHRNGTAIIVEGQTVALRNAAGQLTGYITVNRDISERKAAEAALRASEERYRTLFETMDEGFCIFEMLYNEADEPVDYRFLEVNPAFARFTGLENAVGKTAYELVPNLEPQWVAIYGEVARTGDARHFIEGSAAMGRWFEVYAFRFGGPESRRVALLFTNITERKLTEDALRDSEEELRYTVELNPQVPWTADPAGNIISFNQRWLDLTGMTEEQALGGGWVEAPHPDDRPAMVAAWTHAIQSGEPYDIEHRIRLATGDYRWMRSRAFPRRGRDGAIVRWYGATEDIHERKVAEEQLRYQAHLLANVEDAVITTDLAFQIQSWNRGAEQIYGYTAAEAIGQSVGELLPTTYLDAEPAAVLEAFRTQGRWRGEVKHRRKDGAQVVISNTTMLVYDQQAQPLGVVAINRDVTARKATEDALRRATARFERAEWAAHGFVFESDLHTSHVTRSPNFSQVTGYAQEEVPPTLEGWLALVHPADLLQSDGRIDLRPGGATAYTSEYRIRHKAGHYIWLQEQGLIERDETGRALAIIGTTLDMTARKTAEDALRAREAQFRQLADAMPQIVWQGDEAGAVVYLNQRWYDYTGLTVEQSLADPTQATHPDDQAMAMRAWQEVRPQGKPYEYELRLRRADGIYRWHLVRCVPVYSPKRQLLCWYGTSTDLHDRKEAEIALRTREEQLRLATEAGGVGIFDHDLITNQTEISPIYAQIIGIPLLKTMPREVWLARVHPEDRSMVEAIWENAKATGASYYYECRLIRPDGVLRWIEVNAWVTTNAAGQGIRITGAIRDITERKQTALNQQFLLSLNSTLRTLTDADAIQQTVVEQVGEYLGVDRCRFNAIDLAADKVTLLAAWSRPGLPPPSNITPLSAHAPAAYLASAKAGRTLVVHDVAQDKGNETPKTLLQTRGYAATIRVPCLRAGQWVASLHVLQTTPRPWRADEVQLVENVVHHFWPLVEKARAEARFRAVQQATPDGYMIFESVRNEQGAICDFRWLYLNPASEQMVGRTAADLLGKCLLAEMPGNRETGLFDAYVHVVETGEVYQREFCYQHDGLDRWFRNTAAKAGDGFAVAFSDITAHKQAEVDQQLLAELAEQIRVADDADELVAATVRLLGEHLQVGRCLWIEIYGAQQRGAVRAQHCRGLPPVAEAYEQADYSPATRAELAAGRVLVNHDAQQDPRTAARYETVYAPYQERAYVGVPFLREGAWRGILSVTTPAPRQWQAHEISLLETVAERVWLAVDKLRLVVELRTNEARYRTIFEHAGVSLWEEDFSRVKGGVDELTAAWRAAGVTDLAAAMRSHCAAHPDFVLAMLDRVRILNVNEETVRLYGRPKAELLRPFAHHFDAETVTRFVDQLALLAAGEQRYRFDGPITTPQGETRHIAFTVVFPADDDGDFTRVLLSGLDVTPLKATEVENRRLFLETQSLLAQVQEGERFLQSIADTIPNVIYLFDLRTMRNRYANRHLTVTLGYTAAEAQALGDQFIPALIHPDDQRYLADHLTHLYALADGEMADWEYRMQHKGGEWRWLSSREIVFERDEQGRPAVILGALQDSTARKEAEVALRASEARFRHLAEAMPQVVWTCQADGSLTYINQQWSEYSGIAPAVTLAEGMWPAMHPADHAANREQWRQALTSGEAYEGEVRLRRQDGAYRWFLERAIPVQDEAGAIQQWFGVSMEIHDRKEAEQRQAELVALLEAMLDNAPVGFAFLDREQRFVRINQMLADQHGRSIADHSGRAFAEIAPRATKSVGPILEQVFATGAGIYNREISSPKVANPNEIVHMLASWFPVAVNGVTQYVGSMMVDITERKRQERHQQFLNELGMDLRLLSDTATIVTQVVTRLGTYLQVAGCRINEIDQQRAQFTLQKDWVAADAPWAAVVTPGGYPLRELASPALLAALQAGQTVAVANTLNDPRTAPVAANYEDDQVHSLIGVPIFHQGEWRATLSVKGHGERQWRPDEVTLVEAVASQLSALLEKVRAEEALRTSEERLRLALAGGGMGIWESQLATNRSLWSAEEYALFGLAPGVEITNELFNTLVHPDDLPGLQAALTHLIAAGSDHTGEFRIIRPDGAVRWLADRVTVIRDESGQAVRLLGINFDITERKEREAMIRQQLAEIEAIYATAPIGLCLVDRDLRYVRINETLATINGSTIAEQLGRTLAETQPAEGYQLVEPLYRGVIETGIPLLNREVHESYVDPAQARDWLASYYPLKNADGVVTGVNAVILEITERKRHERQLQELNASLEERVLERTKALAQANHALSITNRELEQFTYAAAHDLRTPLRGIANLVQWIGEDAAPVLSPESQRHLDKLGGRVKRLEKMLEDMLAYSRVGRVRYQPETVDVRQLVQSLLDLLAPPFGFVLKAVGQLPTFAALRIPLELVFRNLLSNAIRHHHAPASGQVVVTVRDLDGWYEFCISDNGPGIDPQYHERIFGMFQTLKPRDQVEGSGIGLALVKKTVESIGGQIRMESALGQGTTFYFTWPKG